MVHEPDMEAPDDEIQPVRSETSPRLTDVFKFFLFR